MSSHRDILEVFLEHATPPPDPEPKGSMYHPPWRDRYLDGTLGPNYGPTTPSAYRKASQDYQRGRGWYPVHVDGAGPCVRIVQREDGTEERVEIEPQRAPGEPRYDAVDIFAFVEREHARLGQRALEVVMLYWRQRQSAGWIARNLGIGKRTVESYITDVRRRCRAWQGGAR